MYFLLLNIFNTYAFYAKIFVALFTGSSFPENIVTYLAEIVIFISKII